MRTAIGQVSIVPKGVWDNTKDYNNLNVVTYNHVAYIALKYVPEGISINNTEYWMQITEGITGPQGIQGITGPTGETGSAAGFGTISANIVTLTPDEESDISVTTSGDNLAKNIDFTFKIPQGTTGPTGPTGNITYATFEVSLTTGQLIMKTEPIYDGPSFQITNNGHLEVVI